MLCYSNLVDELLIAVPEIKPRFDEESSWWDEILPHIVFGDVVVPFVTELLVQPQDNTQTLGRIFAFFERMATSSDEMVSEVLGVTVLEQLGDDRSVLLTAKQFMGEHTKALSDRIEKGLGRLQS